MCGRGSGVTEFVLQEPAPKNIGAVLQLIGAAAPRC